ncbi:unnamed protein product [Laminaria digitata]
MIEKLLNNNTIQAMGTSTTCEWADDSEEVVVYYEHGADVKLEANSTISLLGGYIHGGIFNDSHPIPYTTGTVEIEGRTPEPELHEAQFSDDGTAITVIFSAGGSSSSRLLDPGVATSGSGPGSCSSILDTASVEILGDAATCEWVGIRELNIVVGHGAIAVPDTSLMGGCGTQSSITLLDGGVRTEAFAVLSSSGCTEILPPDYPAPTSAVLVAPQTVGRCGEVTFDGRASSGGASRTLSAIWDVADSTGAPVAADDALRDAFTPFNGSLLATINVTVLEVGAELTVSLTVENFLGMTDNATVSIVRMAEDIPSVVALGSSTKRVTRSRSTSLRMIAEAGACGDDSSLFYTWEEVGGSDYEELGTEAFAALAGTDPTKLTIPPYVFGYAGSTYLFSGVVTSQVSNLSSSTLVVVEQGSLRAYISGGEYRLHAAGTDLVLDGSASVDEDDITELSTRYAWSCSENCSTLSEAYSTGDSEAFTILADELQSGTVYEFSLNVSKGVVDATYVYGEFRSDVTTVKVQVVSYDVPEVVVWAKENSDKFDPTAKLVLYGGVVDTSSAYELLWTQVTGDLPTETQDWSTFFSTSQTGPSLVVRPNVLTAGSSYMFRLSAIETSSRNEGFTQLSVLINSAPYGGHVVASPTAGTAALDVFVLESLDWTDEADDLPLTYFFSYAHGQASLAPHTCCSPIYGLSMYASESPEWAGSLPLGQPVHNYTMSIAAHTSDRFGATTTSYSDADGDAVSVRVTGWGASLRTTIMSTMFLEASRKAMETPGQATPVVRAYVSLALQELTSSDLSSSGTTENTYQDLLGVMIYDMTNDYTTLGYSAETAASVMGVLVLISSEGQAVGSDVQDNLLSSSSMVLSDAVNEGLWDSTISGPAVQLLDGVLGSVDVEDDNILQRFGGNFTSIVQSIMALMEGGVEDGEEAATFDSTYVNVSCVVTSDTDGISSTAGEYNNSRTSGNLNPSRYALRRMTPASVLPVRGRGKASVRGSIQSRRQLATYEAAATSAVTVGSIEFSVNGRPSKAAEGRVTSVRLTRTDDGNDIPLTAPVTITTRASLNSALDTPWCAYYNNDTRQWEEDGLVIAEVSPRALSEGGSDGLEIEISCLTYHLSDFAVSTTGSDGVFAPVELTAAFDVFSGVRNITIMGIMLTVGVVLVMTGVWVAMQVAGKRLKTEGIVQEKIVVHYIETGEAKRQPNLGTLKRVHRRFGNRMTRKRRQVASGRRQLSRSLEEAFRAWHARTRELCVQVLQHHPWAGIVSPSMTSLPFTPAQLSLLLFAQVMVQMMVEAAFSSNAPNLKVKVAQVLVGSAATIPGSIILPYLFEAAVSPPRSITAKSKGHMKVASSSPAASPTGHSPVDGPSTSSTNRENVFLAFVQLIHSELRSRTVNRRQLNVGLDLARARGLAFAGLVQILLDVVCLGLSAAVGVDTLLGRALLALSGVNILLTVLMIDAVLAARTTMFSLVNFKVVFALAYARICVTLMQAVVAFHDLQTREPSSERVMETFIVLFAGVNIVACYSCEVTPCMDAINKNAVTQLSLAKKYGKRSRRESESFMRRTSSTGRPDASAFAPHRVRDEAATRIQALVRAEQAWKRTIRKKEIQLWHRPEVCELRRKFTVRAYAWLGLYAGTALWINLCYVFAYDTPTVWSWVTATAMAIAVDVVLRKPIAVLARGGIQALRDMARVPEDIYGVKGRCRKSSHK